MAEWLNDSVHGTGIIRMQLDSVQIGAADLESAAAAYAVLLATRPLLLPDGRRRFQLARGAVELDSGMPGLHSLAFVAAADSPLRAAPAEAFNGITVRVDAAPPAALPDAALAPAIDHVVVRTMAPERAIALWRDRFGVRLALDRVFAERGLRLLFFRSGGITLEYACPLVPDAAAAPDGLFGVSYRVPQLQAWRSRLVAAGIDVSAIRPGMRPGTSVCSVRSGTAGVPTLLLEVGREGVVVDTR
jgi:catechol 2,3-dioxygenase-like lactoylglutathione lyase family enzyme